MASLSYAKVNDTEAATLLAKMLKAEKNKATPNDAEDEVPDVAGEILQGNKNPNVTDGAGKEGIMVAEEDVAADKVVQGDDTSILLKGKDATITALKAKLASEIGDRVALEQRVAALQIKLRASEERANKMKDAVMFVMGNM